MIFNKLYIKQKAQNGQVNGKNVGRIPNLWIWQFLRNLLTKIFWLKNIFKCYLVCWGY